MYEIFPNSLFSIIFPVNESIWEHMKLIYTSIVLSSIIEYILYKRNNIKVNNFLISIPLIGIFGIVLYLAIYLIIDLFIPHNLVVSIILLFIVFIICEIISYYLLNDKELKHQKIIGIILIIISYIIFGYLTYKPIDNYLFLDTETHSYGIEKN